MVFVYYTRQWIFYINDFLIFRTCKTINGNCRSTNVQNKLGNTLTSVWSILAHIVCGNGTGTGSLHR